MDIYDAVIEYRKNNPEKDKIMKTEANLTITAIKEMFVLMIAIQKVNKCPIIDKMIDQYLDKHELNFVKGKKCE